VGSVFPAGSPPVPDEARADSSDRQAPRNLGPAANALAPVFNYIERFYNPRRRHSKLGYLSPMAFEEQAMRT
jgi:putative transposase